MTDISHLKLLVALGNPREEFTRTFHNAGFIVLDSLLTQPASFRSRAHFSYHRSAGLIFAKSLVFMNESGQAVLSALKFFKVKPDEMLVLHDDSDLELGQIKISYARNSAGHHGVESIIKTLKTKDFYRARIGIRPPTNSRLKAGDFVLKKMTAEDLKKIHLVGDYLKTKLKLNNTSPPA